MIIVDTGPIVAAASQKDPDHTASLAALTSLREPPIISAFVAAEVCYFLATRTTPATEAAFVRRTCRPPLRRRLRPAGHRARGLGGAPHRMNDRGPWLWVW